MLADILLVLAILYCFKIIIFGIAALNARYPSDPSYRPHVSIVIAARNEEHNIRRCVDSLVRLSYPTDLLEIVMVDDRSEDRTAEIVREYSSRFSHIRLHTAIPGGGSLRGKANAVDQGIDQSHGEIVLFTDADCSVPTHWVEETVKYYTDASVGIVAGFTSLRVQAWFDAIQAIDWFVLFSVAAATVRLRYPVTAVGNNLSVRREAYNRVGGYRNIPFSVTEDYALFHAITNHPGYRAVFPLDEGALVESGPCKTWRELYLQKKRWFTGGKGMDVKSLLVFTIPFILNLALLVGIFFVPASVLLTIAALKTSVDFFLAIPTLHRFRRWGLVKYFPFFELYYTSYVLLFPIVVVFATRVVWKDRTFGDGGTKTPKPPADARGFVIQDQNRD